MSLDSWNGIAQHLSKSGDDRLMESFLEFLSHIVCHLSNAMQRGVSDFRVRMLKVLDNDWNHWSNLPDIIEVLSNLRESH
jgi:hypothetical protein